MHIDLKITDSEFSSYGAKDVIVTYRQVKIGDAVEKLKSHKETNHAYHFEDGEYIDVMYRHCYVSLVDGSQDEDGLVYLRISVHCTHENPDDKLDGTLPDPTELSTDDFLMAARIVKEIYGMLDPL